MQNNNSKTIAKNTVFLYFRMLFTLIISLYTSRIVLNTLGVEDFGIYNVVGGVVLMFSFLNSAMSSGTQRFLSFELGKNNLVQLGKVFSMSINIHATIAIVILILAETIGLWFLNTQLNISENRIVAANWVYQFSILAFMVTVMSVPYNASIVAHERMNIYAYVSIVEVALKLLIIFMLQWFGYDKLKLYAILVFFVSLFINLIYRLYCKRNLKECNYQFFWDKSLYKNMLNYAGWNLWGNAASVTFNQGINILLNIFFGSVVNAARGIAYQVNGAVNGFVSNFQMAMNPQIVKSYAANDRTYMHLLIFRGAKYSFFLLYLIGLPILIETEPILAWWLKVVPQYSVIFCRLVIINTLIDCISGPLMTAAQATGTIKRYQFIVGGLLLLILPISYLFLRIGFPPQATLFVSITVSIVALFTRLWIIRPLVNLSITMFTRSVLAPILLVVLFSSIPPLFIKYTINQELWQLFTVFITSILSVTGFIYLLGLKKEEQIYMKSKLQQVINRIKGR